MSEMSNGQILRAIREHEGTVDQNGSLNVLIDAAREVLERRATMKRLEAWAEQLDMDTHARRGTGVGPFIAAELRNRMKGG
jgi:hypothetical protein